MKRKLSKEDFEKLSDVQKTEYEEKNGSYFLKLEDDEDAVAALRQAKENEVNSHKETKAKLKEMEKRIEEITGEKNRKEGNVEAIDKSWKEKFAARETELTSEINKFKSNLLNSTKDNLLNGLASKLAKTDTQRIFKKAVEERISVEFDGEKVIHRILDKTGKPSAMTLEDFEKEIIANKEFAPIIVTNKASGGDSGTTKPKFGAGSANGTEKPLVSLTAAEMAARISARNSS